MKRIAIILLLFAAVALQMFLRSPVVDDTFCDPDVAGAAYSAQTLAAGGDLYADTVETKPPATYWLYAALFRHCGKDMRWVYLTSIGMYVAVLLCLFGLGRAMIDEWGGLIAAGLYALYSTNTAVNGWCPNFEAWPLLPLALGFALLWIHLQKPHWRWPLLAGVCAGAAVLFKQNVAVIPLAGLSLVWIAAASEHRVWRFARDASLGLSGALLPLVAATAWFAARGQAASLFASLHPAQALGYAFSEQLGETAQAILKTSGKLIVHQKFLLAFLPVLLGLLFVEKWRKDLEPKRQRALTLILAWLLGAMGAVAAGSKFFDHYFVLLLPPLAMTAAFVLRVALPRLIGNRAVPLMLTVVVLLGAVWDNRLEIAVAGQAASDRAKSGRMLWNEGDDYFWRAVDLPAYQTWNYALRETGACLAGQSDPGAPIYVWDYAPELYWFADRRAPTRHFMYFEVATELPAGSGRWHSEAGAGVEANRRRLLSDLQANAPLFIVTFTPHEPPANWLEAAKQPAPMFPALQNWVEANYSPDSSCTGRYLTVLRRNP